MLIIRQSTLDALGRVAHDDFVARTRAHLHKFFPEHCDALGDAKTGEMIEFGIERARAHGFESQRDVLKYIDLICLLGPDFDHDERLPWAQQILDSRLPAEPAERMELLQHTALDALRARQSAERPHGRD